MALPDTCYPARSFVIRGPAIDYLNGPTHSPALQLENAGKQGNRVLFPTQAPTWKGPAVAVRHNYGFEKYQRDQVRKKKQEEKRQRKAKAREEKSAAGDPAQPAADASSSDAN